MAHIGLDTLFSNLKTFLEIPSLMNTGQYHMSELKRRQLLHGFATDWNHVDPVQAKELTQYMNHLYTSRDTIVNRVTNSRDPFQILIQAESFVPRILKEHPLHAPAQHAPVHAPVVGPPRSHLNPAANDFTPAPHAPVVGPPRTHLNPAANDFTPAPVDKNSASYLLAHPEDVPEFDYGAPKRASGRHHKRKTYYTTYHLGRSPGH